MQPIIKILLKLLFIILIISIPIIGFYIKDGTMIVIGTAQVIIVFAVIIIKFLEN